MRGDSMEKRCETCKYAEWEEVSTDRGSYWDYCGCTLTPSQCKEIEEDAKNDGTPIPEYYDDEWGDTKDCPYWKMDDENL